MNIIFRSQMRDDNGLVAAKAFKRFGPDRLHLCIPNDQLLQAPVSLVGGVCR